MKIRFYTIVTALSLLLAAGTAFGQDLELHGFMEGAYGTRIDDNPAMGDNDNTLGETRVQLQAQHFGESAEFFGSIDFLRDAVDDGVFSAQIREAYMKFRIGTKADIKVGRQVVTWGTGDMLFINDIFPKDYVSFFTGREDQYLKSPSDALLMKFFTPVFDIDVAAIPYFDPDRMPTGLRLSSFNPLAGGIVGASALPAPDRPSGKLSDGEVALRLYRYLGSFQLTGYFSHGYYKAPMGVDMTRGVMYHPELNTYGASVRGPLWSGVLSAEYGYYDSSEDGAGNDPLVPNSQHRYLFGFERQWWTDFTAGAQYYGEFMADHDRYTGSLFPGMPEFDELRQVLTLRLTRSCCTRQSGSRCSLLSARPTRTGISGPASPTSILMKYHCLSVEISSAAITITHYSASSRTITTCTRVSDIISNRLNLIDITNNSCQNKQTTVSHLIYKLRPVVFFGFRITKQIAFYLSNSDCDFHPGLSW